VPRAGVANHPRVALTEAITTIATTTQAAITGLAYRASRQGLWLGLPAKPHENGTGAGPSRVRTPHWTDRGAGMPSGAGSARGVEAAG
jgi:hypothetical protein